MPGTGHSARYKGSISNRVRISPFQRLAEWNAQLLGTDGAVPTITGGGGSLAFKKLDASDIAGVMTNPAVVPLDMVNLGISNVGSLGGVSTINAAGPVQANTLNIGPFNADNTIQNISLGNALGTKGNKSVNIMNFGSYTTGISFLRLGNSTVAGTQISSLATTITGVNALTLSSNTIISLSSGSIGLTSETTTVIGSTRLNLHSSGGGDGIFIGTTNSSIDINIGQSADKIGFFGHGPITRPDVELTSPADTALERSTKINNFMMKMSNQIGGGLGLITTSGP